LGATVVGLADEPYNNLSRELQESLTEYHRVNSLENFEEVKGAFHYIMSRFGKENWVIESHNEHWLELEAKLRDEFNLQGYKLEDLSKVKRKSGMKELYRSEGVPVARGKVLDSLQDCQEFVKQVGYPIIAKPDIGVGASDTFKISNEDQLIAFLSHRRNRNFIFEEFIDGDIESFDGLTDTNGNIVFYTSHIFNSGIMEVVTEDEELSYYSVRKVPEDIRELGFRSIKAANLKAKFFHLEFFRTKKDKQVVALEMNMRPPGGFTVDMFNFANDIDLYDEWASIIVKKQFNSSHYSRPYFCCYVGRKDKFHYMHSHEDILAKYSKQIVKSGVMPEIFQKVMGAQFYIFRTSNLDELTSIRQQMYKRGLNKDA